MDEINKETNPLISVIVPVYKVEAYLERCIQSVLAQDYSNYELLLIDDGSPDRCGDICEEYAAEHQQIRVFHKENGGLSSARNMGLDHMRGQFVTFIDSDDYVTPDYLSYLYSLFSVNPVCKVTACIHYIVRGNKKNYGIFLDKEIEVFTREEAFDQLLFHGKVDVSAWAKMYRSTVFSDLRYPEGHIFEDTWLIGDILNRTSVFVSGKRCCYYYEVRQGSLVNERFRLQNLQYIESAEKLAKDAELYDPELYVGGIRRINHARLSVLRYMGNCEDKYKPLRIQLRKEILSDAGKYYKDPRTPKRDKMAINLLKIGLKAYFFGWNLYEIMR